MSGYNIVDHEMIDKHIIFIRINPTDIALTLKEVFDSLSDLAWISAFDGHYLQTGYKTRAELSIAYIAANIIGPNDDAVTSESGEYVVSELARKTVVDYLKYLHIPLGDLIKEKEAVNHGFDFFSRNLNEVLLFGEAKYNKRDNAYGTSFEQIIRFENEKRDHSDLIDIDRFCCENSKNNFSNGVKGFIAAFASKKTSTPKLIAGIKKNRHFIAASKFTEVICIAVNI